MLVVASMQALGEDEEMLRVLAAVISIVTVVLLTFAVSIIAHHVLPGELQPAKQSGGAPVVPKATPSQSATSISISNFAEWKRTVAAPAIQNECAEKARHHGLVEGRQIEHMARVCACYGVAAVNVLDPADVENEAVRASPELNAKLSDEARRLCKTH